MENLRCYYPFFHIYISPLRDKNLSYDVPFLSLDILTLLIEDGKLKNRSVKLTEIIVHMKELLRIMYPDRSFSETEVKEATWTVLKFLETSNTKGESYYFTYHDYNANKDIKTTPLQFAEYDLKNDAYRITDVGLDFMINTKELFEEAKIKVSLILFQQQIKKGFYDVALQTIHNLKLEVYRKMDQKQRLLEMMMYGGQEVIGEYSKFKKSIRYQFEEEKLSFQEIRDDITEKIKDIRETRDEFDNRHNRIDEKKFLILNEISTEFERSFALHTRLFEQYMGLLDEYLRISKTRRDAIGTKKFLFEKTMKEHIRSNLPNDIHVVKMHPLLSPDSKKVFGLLKIFEPQSIVRKKEADESPKQEEEWNKKMFIDDIMKEQQLNHFTKYADILLSSFKTSKEIDLRMFLDKVSETLGLVSLQNPNLIQFLVELNIGIRDFVVANENNISEHDVNMRPYETSFNLEKLEKLYPRGIRLIGIAIKNTEEKMEIPYSSLKVNSIPTDKILIDREDNSYITNMKFTME
jgi:hypothetical protein